MECMEDAAAVTFCPWEFWQEDDISNDGEETGSDRQRWQNNNEGKSDVPASDDEDGDEDEQQNHAADNGDQEDRGVRAVADNRRRNCGVGNKIKQAFKDQCLCEILKLFFFFFLLP